MKTFFLNLNINGQKYKIFAKKPLSILDLIVFFNFNKQLIITEYNGKIYNNLEYIYLKNFDLIEIITIVGGG